MKTTLATLILSLMSSTAFATSNAMIDRLQTGGALQKIETKAQAQIKLFAKDPNLNLYGFKMDWNDNLGKQNCTSLDATLVPGAGSYYDDTEPYAGTCIIPYESLHASGYLTLIMTTAHEEKDADVVIMNIVLE